MINGKLLANAFPINKVEVFFDNLDHSDFLGFTWERVGTGKMPIGIDIEDTDFDTIGETGGTKTSYSFLRPGQNTFHLQNGAGGYGDRLIVSSTVQTSESETQEYINNMPPYIVMAFWKRVA